MKARVGPFGNHAERVGDRRNESDLSRTGHAGGSDSTESRVMPAARSADAVHQHVDAAIRGQQCFHRERAQVGVGCAGLDATNTSLPPALLEPVTIAVRPARSGAGTGQLVHPFPAAAGPVRSRGGTGQPRLGLRASVCQFWVLVGAPSRDVNQLSGPAVTGTGLAATAAPLEVLAVSRASRRDPRA